MVAVKAFVCVALLFLTSISYASPYGQTLCKNGSFSCYKVKQGDTWQSLFGGGYQQTVAMKLNRTNLRLRPGSVIAIPNSNATLMDISPFPTNISAPGERIIIVSLGKLAWGAYNSQGQLVNWGPVSGGQSWCADVKRGCRTITGKFAIYNKGGPGCVSTKFPVGRGGAPMPYCMFFHKGYALHGSPLVPGHHASHGCVRLFTEDARWLNREFLSGGMGVPVIIKSEVKLDKQSTVAGLVGNFYTSQSEVTLSDSDRGKENPRL